GADQLAACPGVGVVQTLMHPLGELLQVLDDRTHVLVTCLSLQEQFMLSLDFTQAFSGRSDARLEFVLVDESIREGVGESVHGTLGTLPSTIELLTLRRRTRGVLPKTTFVLGLDTCRVGEQRPDIVPDGGFQCHLRHRGKRTYLLAIAAPAIATNAAVVA